MTGDMSPFHFDQAAVREAHARLSVALPVSFHSPLRMAAPLEKDNDDPAPADRAPRPARQTIWDL